MFGSNDDKKTPAEPGEKKGLFGWLRKKPQPASAEQPATEPQADSEPVEQTVANVETPAATPQHEEPRAVEADLQPTEVIKSPPPDPEPEPEPEPEPQTVKVSETAQEDRVAHLEVPDSVTNGQQITSIRILEQPETGHVSVSQENGINLVMTEAQKGLGQIGFSYEVTLADNTVVRVDADIDLTPAQELDGWGLGENYMLETDAKGELVIEHGDNHRKVYISGGEDALTKEDIAAREGTTVAAIDKTYGGWGAWLAKHPEYGASEDMALTDDLGMALWDTLTKGKTTSNWLMFERGYEYENASRLFSRGANGESELNPMVVTAYGEGDDPVLGMMNVFQNPSSHMVITGVKLTDGAQALLGTNLLVDNVSVGGSGGNFHNVNGLTIRNSDFIDIVREAPVNTGDTWQPHVNRIQGLYLSNNDGARLEGNFFDKNSWTEGYDYKLAAKLPQPPSMYSHNIYIQDNNLDVTLIGNIIMRGASFGAQVRSGGFIEGNVFLDNNAAVNFGGGVTDAHIWKANYTLMLDNIITSAGHKRVSAAEGALSMGIDDYGKQSSLIGNIITHLADPNNAQEIASKLVTHKALSAGHDRFFDDTIIYRWAAGSKGSSTNPNKNVAGLDKAVLDKTTIQEFASAFLGKKGATIADLAAFLRAQADGQLDDVLDAGLIIAFFREGFGLDVSARTENETLVFMPDARGDGVRWDNKLNWSTGDMPGEGDSIDLAGNAVRFSNFTVAVDDFDFGDFGKLTATSGKLSIDGDIGVGDKGALLSIDRSGQVWIDGYRDRDLLEIDVAGGRFANKGDMVGRVDIHVSDNAQALLAIPGGSLDLMKGSSLAIEGSKVKVGFDGHNGDTGVLRMHDGSTLSFKAEAGGLSTLGEFRSGAFGKATDIDTAIRLDGDLRIDISAWRAGKNSVTETLIKADQLVGSFDSIEVVGLADNRNATIIIDYDADEFRFVLGPDNGIGTGEISTVVIGANRAESWSQDAGLRDLWQALHDPLLSTADDPLSL